MTGEEAMAPANGAPLVAVATGALAAVKERLAACEAAGIAARIGKEEAGACCSSGGCGGGKFELLVSAGDVPRFAALVKEEWAASLRREGVAPIVPVSEEGCPACGFAGPTNAGACGDCGLQLE